VTNDPTELHPETDVEMVADDVLGDGLDDDLEEGLEDDLADGFVVDGEDDADDEDDSSADGDDDPDGSSGVAGGHSDGEDDGATVDPEAGIVAEEPDDFEEEIAPVVRVPDEEEDAPGRQAGEFICTRCFMVKKDIQMAVRSRKVCRDCA